MADISIRRGHDLGRDEARASIGKLASKLAERLGGEWRWEGDTAVCESRGAVARVGYDDREISVEVTLPRLLKPLRRRLEDKIDESFDRYFRRA
jgi:putative polyhydroxyalkanoate system protein